MRYLVSALLVVVGAIHLLPLSGLAGAAQLNTLYGLDFSDPNLAVLMRHRAVLFGLVGALCLFAAFRSRLQPLALVAAAISVVSFLLLAWDTGQYNASLARVVAADLVALACLVVAAGLRAYEHRRR
jgi:hypothetical protein